MNFSRTLEWESSVTEPEELAKLEKAKKSIKIGMIVTALIVASTIVATSIALLVDAQGKFAICNDPWNFLDVALVLIIGYGLYRNSCLASIVLFLYYVLTRINIALETSSMGFIPMIIILIFLGNAIDGTWQYHKLRMIHDESYRSISYPKRVFNFIKPLLIAFLFVTLLLIGFISLIAFNVIPGSRTIGPDDLSQEVADSLIQKQILSQSDSVLLYFTPDFFSFTENGVLFTENNIIEFTTNDEIVSVQTCNHLELSKVEPIFDENNQPIAINLVCNNKENIHLDFKDDIDSYKIFYSVLADITNKRDLDK